MTTFTNNLKTDPRNKIDVEIGDSKEPTFMPQIKTMRWDNEVNLSIRLVDNEIGAETVREVDDKIIWEKGNLSSDFYALENGYEFEITLKEKPKTNIIEFSIEDKDVEFYPQIPFPDQPDSKFPDLQGKITKTVTEVTGSEGGRIYRAEKVSGGYSIHTATPKINRVGGTLYRCGKVGSIYRPQLIDAKGQTVWGDLLVEHGILSVTAPWDFLNSATYPIRHAAGLTIGYTEVGENKVGSAIDYKVGSHFDAVSDDVCEKIYGWVETGTYDNGPLRFAILKRAVSPTTTYTTVEQSAEITPIPDDWNEQNLVTQIQEVENGTTYLIGQWGEELSTAYDDAPAGSTAYTSSSADYIATVSTWGLPGTAHGISLALSRKYSYYVEFSAGEAYTAAGALSPAGAIDRQLSLQREVSGDI